MVTFPDVSLMKLAGVRVSIPNGCYSSGGSLYEFSGSTETIENCIRACVVSVITSCGHTQPSLSVFRKCIVLRNNIVTHPPGRRCDILDKQYRYNTMVTSGPTFSFGVKQWGVPHIPSSFYARHHWPS